MILAAEGRFVYPGLIGPADGPGHPAGHAEGGEPAVHVQRIEQVPNSVQKIKGISDFHRFFLIAEDCSNCAGKKNEWGFSSVLHTILSSIRKCGILSL
jgi:hypothetical protein